MVPGSWCEWIRSQSLCIPLIVGNLGLEGTGLHVRPTAWEVQEA